MLKTSKKFSVILSITLSVTFFLVCVFLAAVMPFVADALITARDSINPVFESVLTTDYTVILILAYLVLAVAMLADGLLFALLLRVYSEKVFTSISVGLIRGVSWCCFLICLIFCGLGLYFQLGYVVAFAAAFLGLCIRVVKNVIEEATEIKSENDLTV